MKKLTIMVLWLLAAAGCRTTPVAGECPESVNLHCMSRKICTEDRKRGCLSCRCEAVWNTDRFNEDERIRGRTPE